MWLVEKEIFSNTGEHAKIHETYVKFRIKNAKIPLLKYKPNKVFFLYLE